MIDVTYLGCPYTHDDESVKEFRFEQATKAAAFLITKGHIVYSPITMTHPIDVILAGRTSTLGSDYWVKFDLAFMAMCTRMVIITLPGWDVSNGIRREVNYFKSKRRPIDYWPPSVFGL